MITNPAVRERRGFVLLAEAEGFEPSEPFQTQQFSRLSL